MINDGYWTESREQEEKCQWKSTSGTFTKEQREIDDDDG